MPFCGNADTEKLLILKSEHGKYRNSKGNANSINITLNSVFNQFYIQE